MPSTQLPQLHGVPLVTDGGLETVMVFQRGLDLPEFAAFPLVRDAPDVLTDYYTAYAAVAAAAGAGLVLETPTWRASGDWADRLGWSSHELDAVNREAAAQLRALAERLPDLPAVVVSGQLGPRGDGYQPELTMSADEAAAYHRPQVSSLAAGGADMVNALTLTGVAEATGVVQAARDCGIPVAVSFTVETDGRLPDGTTLADAIETVDAAAPPDYFGVNCAHPDHIAPALAGPGPWERIRAVRANASTLSHAELDEATELDDGDPPGFGPAHQQLRDRLPSLTVLGGCCGTDVRHVASIWGTPAPTP